MNTSLSSDPLPEVEVLHAIPTGTRVRCWDGSVGIVDWSSLSEVDVVYPSVAVGRGPWRFERWQVEVAS